MINYLIVAVIVYWHLDTNRNEVALEELKELSKKYSFNLEFFKIAYSLIWIYFFIKDQIVRFREIVNGCK